MNTLFTTEQYNRLLENGNPANRDKDHAPVVMLTIPFTSCIWLLSELNPEQPNIAFGLCDLGMGYPELGYVDLDEIQLVKHPVFQTGVCVSSEFEGVYPMSAYSKAARVYQQIIWDKNIIARYVIKKATALNF